MGVYKHDGYMVLMACEDDIYEYMIYNDGYV